MSRTPGISQTRAESACPLVVLHVSTVRVRRPTHVLVTLATLGPTVLSTVDALGEAHVLKVWVSVTSVSSTLPVLPVTSVRLDTMESLLIPKYSAVRSVSAAVTAFVLCGQEIVFATM